MTQKREDLSPRTGPLFCYRLFKYASRVSSSSMSSTGLPKRTSWVLPTCRHPARLWMAMAGARVVSKVLWSAGTPQAKNARRRRSSNASLPQPRPR